MTGADKRSTRRINLMYYLKVYQRETGKEVGRLLDVTQKGLQLLSKEEIEKGKSFHLTIELPEMILGEDFVHLEALSLRSEKGEYSDFFNTGFTITQKDRKAERLITHLMDTYEFPHLEEGV